MCKAGEIWISSVDYIPIFDIWYCPGVIQSVLWGKLGECFAGPPKYIFISYESIIIS